MKVTSFPAIAAEDATILILGSMPGETSLERQQYYAHPRNAFWQIMETITGAGRDLPYEIRIRHLCDWGIALWDVLQYCEREGSLDSGIKAGTEVPNDFIAFFRSHPNIRYIFFNGRKVEKAFVKHVWPHLPPDTQERMTLATLPSTSPANTRSSIEMKRAEWQKQIIMRTALAVPDWRLSSLRARA